MVESNFIDIAKNAKLASKKLATLSTDIKNQALLAIAEGLDLNKNIIFSLPFEKDFTSFEGDEILVDKNGEKSEPPAPRIHLVQEVLLFICLNSFG